MSRATEPEVNGRHLRRARFQPLLDRDVFAEVEDQAGCLERHQSHGKRMKPHAPRFRRPRRASYPFISAPACHPGGVGHHSRNSQVEQAARWRERGRQGREELEAEDPATISAGGTQFPAVRNGHGKEYGTVFREEQEQAGCMTSFPPELPELVYRHPKEQRWG